MRLIIILCIFTTSFLQGVRTYASQINLSTTTTSTISNFYQDFSSCSCDRTPSLCDNYCCCDSVCPTVSIFLFRLPLPAGQTHLVASPLLQLYSIYATNHRAQATGHSKICRAFTSRIEGQSVTSIKICHQPPSTTPQ